MSFINPFFLYLLPLAALPLIIHLIGRQRYTKQEFSTLRFLKQLEIDLIRKLKIRQILLLILRILLILVLIIVFARPYRSGRSPGVYVGKGETLYLVVDNSLSMRIQDRGQTMLDVVKAGVITAAEQIDFPIHVKVIETTRAQRVVDAGLISNPSGIGKILASVEISNRHGKIDLALQSVRNDLKSRRELNPAIWILSDFQENNFQSQQPFAELINKTNCRVIFFPAVGKRENVALTAISLPGQLFRLNQPVPVQANLASWHSASLEVPVALFLGDQKLGQVLTTLTPFGESQVRFEFLPVAPGFQRARLEIADDRLMLDNRRYFSVNIPDQIRVLIVSRDPSDSRFIKRALEAEGSAVVRIKLASVGLFLTEDLSRFDVLIFSNVDRIPENGRRKLDYYFGMDRRVLIFPGEDCRPESFNALWADGYGFPRWRTTQRAAADQFLKFGNADMNHPVFSRLLRHQEDFEYSPEFFTVPGFSLRKNHNVLATFENNTPFIVEVLSEGNRGILIAAAPTANWSNLQLTGFFPVLMNRLVYYLAQPDVAGANNECGDTLYISPSQLSIREDLVVHTPDKRQLKLALGLDDPILFDDTEEPGFYTIFSKGRQITQYVVNIPEAETTAGFLGESDFKNFLKMYPGKLNVVFSDEENGLNPLEYSREYSNWLIGMVLILALVETYIGRINRKTRAKLKSG